MKLLVSLLAASAQAASENNEITCDAGYELEPQNKTECLDINECNNGGCLGPAANFCQNLDGSFECGCSAGYSLGDDKQTCSDIDECLNENACQDNATCKNNAGGFTCTCNAGYTKTCDDELNCTCELNDNCDPNPCAGDCTNGVNTYTCSCPAGQEIDPDNADGCINVNECAGDNMCDTERGNCVDEINTGFHCTCNSGYLLDGVSNCIDEDECDQPQGNPCEGDAFGAEVCQNNIGSYECVCPQGMTRNADNDMCEDTEDNCTPDSCGANEDCTDAVDGVSCACSSGYKLDDDNNCVDEDECFESTHSCSSSNVCRNTVGSHACDCPEGFKNTAPEGSATPNCVDINECTEGSISVFSCPDPNKSVCKNGNDGTYSCECDAGYELNGDVCTDIVDCPANCDEDNGSCVDGNGSYECFCNDHYDLQDDGSCVKTDYCGNDDFDCTHIADSSCKDDPVGSYTCACVNSTLTDVFKNVTNEWGNVTTEELDYQYCLLPVEEAEDESSEESSEEPVTCGANQIINGEGKCVCGPTFESVDGACVAECSEGYHRVEGSCVDKNECSGDGVFTCNDPGKGVCVNDPGSYHCDCSPGFEGANCDPIDECLPDSCMDEPNTYCEDAHLGFTCECNAGYSNEDGGNCTWVDRCETDTTLNCNATAVSTCFDLGEGETLFCGETTCAEECVENASCINNGPGNFACGCDDGFKSVNDTCVDKDECAAGEVGDINCKVGPENVNCQNTDGSYYCNCGAGYTHDENMVCVSTTDCNGSQNCSLPFRGVCEERDGAELYECDCDEGYQFSGTPYDSYCVDIDECTVDPMICNDQQFTLCNDNDGSYTCDCFEGYAKDSDGVCQDIDECADDSKCANGSCNNLAGSYSCTCDNGFWNKDGTGKSCVDVNECLFDNSATYTCQESRKNTCVNEEGGYSCKCNQGWVADEAGNCVDQDECLSAGNNCHKDATCSDNGDGNGFTCTCNAGFEGSGTQCDDVNECLTADNPCLTDVNSNCVNDLFGEGAHCECNEWYAMNAEGICEDIDECNGEGTFICDEPNKGQCINDIGTGYHCDCNDGFYLDGSVCKDLDECHPASNPCDANASCQNNDGGYSCTCNDGYAGNGHTCEDIDECAAEACSDENSTCENNDGGYSCRCNKGYVEVSNTCVDYDECNEGGNPCLANYFNETIPGRSGCLNTDGSYECTCAPGLKEDETTGDCTDVDECKAGGYACGPNGICTNVVLRDGSTGFTCECEDGFQGGYFAGAFFCSDINECTDDNNRIECGFGGRCENTNGGFKCHCPKGYQLNDDGLCADINECDIYYECGQGEDKNRGRCDNIDGSYTCLCNQGWKEPEADKNQTVCQPVNECQNGDSDCDDNATCDDVESVRENGWVGFTCSCNEFYQGDGNTCEDINECDAKTHDCDAVTEVCQNDVGTGFTCGCADGYAPNAAKNDTCEDVDECAFVGSDYPCDVNALCTNVPGSYECECQGEYTGDGTKGNCAVCPSDECWNWDAVNKKCTLKENTGNNACTSITCDYNSMAFGWNSALFGLNKGDFASFVDPNVDPEYNATEDAYSWSIGLEGEGVTYDVVDGNVVFKYFLALSGSNRARSDLSVDGREIDLGAKTLFTSPFGIGVEFVCKYPTTVSVSSEDYSVVAVDLTYEREGVGSFANAFSIVIGDGSVNQFILGEILDVAVEWSQVGLSDLAMSVTGCSIAHGDKNIAIVKNGCYAEVLEVVSTGITDRKSDFSYKLFKGVGVNSVDQTLTCEAEIFKASVKDPRPSSDADCPVQGNDFFFNYKAPSANLCKKIKRDDEDALYCSLSCFDWENDGKKLFGESSDWALLMDELSILANANVGETDAECDINRLAEQGAVYCQMLEEIDDTCFNFGRVGLIISLMEAHCNNDWYNRIKEHHRKSIDSIDWGACD